MNRNEYRRAFIMLRAAAQGYGGHVRLERRTLTGSMYFIVSAPEGVGPLRAALAGQRDGQYYATPLGTLSRDRRGQLTLAWQFDPRGIDGRPLEAYAWVAVAQTGDACRVVLTGNVEGSRELDPVRLEHAVCALYAAEEGPAADLPDAAEAPAATEGASGPPAQANDTQSDIKIYTGTRARVFTPMPANAPEPGQPAEAQATSGGNGPSDSAGETTPDAGVMTPDAGETTPAVGITTPAAGVMTPSGAGGVPSAGAQAASAMGCTSAVGESTPAGVGGVPSTETQAASAVGCTPTAGESTPNGAGSAPSVEARVVSAVGCAPTATEPTPAGASESAAPRIPAAPQTAAQVLGLDITRPWPAAAEPLRRLFATQAPAEAAPDGEYVYVVAPMPRASGYASSLAGLRAENGRVTGLRYALPARYAPQPPAGLEDYRWLGGGGDGWWVFDMTV